MANQLPIAAWVERMLPPRLEGEGLLRARFFVWGWLLAGSFLLASALLYAFAGIWSQAVLSSAGAIVGGVMLALHRRGLGFRLLTNASLAVGSLIFGASALAQTPADFTSLSLLLIMPMLANYLLGSHVARAWLVISIAWAGLMTVCVDQGWTLSFVDPAPTVTHVVNLGVGVTVAWLMSRRFDRLREESIARLEAADRARRAFLANVSHEIRTPMNGVLGMTEVLLQDELSPAHREQLETIQRSGRALVSLINDLLDLSKMEAGKLRLDLTDFNLDTVLGDLQTLLAPMASQKQLALVIRRAPEVSGRVRGDRMRLGQVLTNLMGNAVKFTARGEVRLEVTVVPNDVARVRFEIIDTGPGIAPEVLPRLFSAFEQGDASTTRRHGGTGLGLVLSQQLVGLMGGRLSVESKPGHGSRFWFDIPLEESEEPSAVRVLPTLTHQPRRPVLVVDDNAINLKVAIAMVERAGYRCDSAVDGRQALEAVQRTAYALVLMDCHMPEMDGFEATERIRALHGDAARTPIVALTASAMPDDLEACRRAGMSQVLTKPLSFASLVQVLEQLG